MKKNSAIFKLNPSVAVIRGGIAYDADGNIVSYDEAAVTTEANMMALRAERNQRLAQTDWWASSDLTMTEAQKAYRQALRDITEQTGFPENIDWPQEPTE